MIVGYARTSTTEQIAGLEAQVATLKSMGCEKIYQEQMSAMAEREQLEKALDFVREGDVFVVTKIDRLARSVPNLVEIIQLLDSKAVGLHILDLGMDTHTPTGKLMVSVLGAVAQFEREMMLERQKAGIQKAKSAGKYKGRAGYSKDKRQAVTNLAKVGLTRTNIAKQLDMSEATVYRILAESRKGEKLPSKAV